MLRIKHLTLKLLTLLLVFSFLVSAYGQSSLEVYQKDKIDFEISEVIQDQLETLLNKEEKVASMIPLLETLCHKDPILAKYLVDTISTKLINKSYTKDWAQLKQLETWLNVEEFSENEEIELLLSNALECKEFFEDKGFIYWQAKTYSLLANIHYNISYNNDDSLYIDAWDYAEKALNLLSEKKIKNQNSYSILGEIYRVKGSISFNKSGGNLDTALALYDTGLEYYKINNDQSGQADIYLNKAIVLTKKEKENLLSQQSESSFEYYKKAIAICKQENDLLKLRLEFATYLEDKFLATNNKIWSDQSNDQLRIIINSNTKKKCEAYFQLAMNRQNFLVLNASGLSKTEQTILIDSIAYFYEQTFIHSKKENNLKFYNEIFDRLSAMCPHFPNMKCSNLLELAGKIKTYFLQENKKINKKVTQEYKQFQTVMAAQKRQYILQWFLITLLLIFVIFLILLQQQKVKNLNTTIAIKQEALRAQMNPHFISNTINAIESLVNQERNEEASEYLIDFSRLCRLVIEYSKCTKISLQDEVDTLKYFLSLEKLRLADDLEYTISIDNQLNADHIMIPPLILQPFVENAIWHGIKNKPEPKKGELKIEVNKLSHNSFECIIEDNGVGREKAMEIQQASVIDQKSWGMALTQQRIDHLKQYNHAKLEIIDLYNKKNQSRGTKVKLQLSILSKKEK